MEYVSQFLSMLTLVFSVASIIAGIFTAYFGSGRSRAVGGGLIVIGLLVFVIFLYGANLLGFMGAPEGMLNFQGVIVKGIIAIVGGIIGALIALGLFLLAIMKA
ncbi:MAG: hypothetical protein V5A64_02945 [Candidatus Thermoplasmatota archaeon]